MPIRNNKSLLLLLIAILLLPSNMNAQSKKPWAMLCNGTLTFSYGHRPTIPSQINCLMCNMSMAFGNNYCGNCGRKNSKDFKVYEVPPAVQQSEISTPNSEKRIKVTTVWRKSGIN